MISEVPPGSSKQTIFLYTSTFNHNPHFLSKAILVLFYLYLYVFNSIPMIPGLRLARLYRGFATQRPSSKRIGGALSLDHVGLKHCAPFLPLCYKNNSYIFLYLKVSATIKSYYFLPQHPTRLSQHT